MRTAGSALLIVVALLLAAVAGPALWLQHNVVQRDGFVALAGPLGSNDEFQKNLSHLVAAQTTATMKLPVPLKELAAGVIASTARGLSADPGYPQAWTDTLARSHTLSFEAAGNTEIEGDLQLDIAPLVAMVTSRVGQALGITLPAPTDVVVSLDQPQAARILPLTSTLGGSSGWMIFISAALMVLGFIVARRRSLVLILMGIGMALVALAWLLGSGLAGTFFTGVTAGPEVAARMASHVFSLAQESWQGGITVMFTFAAVVVAAGGLSLMMVRRRTT